MRDLRCARVLDWTRRTPMTTGNIFLIDPRLGPEDRLTYSWGYVLNSVPGLGQRFVDFLVERCGLPASEFKVAIDHPRGTQRDRPDFLIRCEHWDALFEHKLDSPLGVVQLERYLEHASTRGRTYLGFVAPQMHHVSSDVIGHVGYIRPKTAEHFLWQDFYPLVEASGGKLAADFAEYMGVLGVRPWRWGTLGDPLSDPTADAALRTVFAEIAASLRENGWSCRMTPTSFAMELRTPLPGIQLAYLKARQSIVESDFRIPGRVLILKIWVRRAESNPGLVPMFGYLRGSDPRTYVAPDGGRARWDPSLTADRIYSASLDEMLGQTPEGAAERITRFVETCLEHLQGRGSLVSQDRGEA